MPPAAGADAASRAGPSDAATLHAVLVDAAGADAVRVGDAIPEAVCHDWSGLPPVRPRAWVRPGDTGAVSRVLAACHRLCVPVVPQGGRTGLVGGAMPLAGGVVVSFERMAAIEVVDASAGTLQAQAGATLAVVQQAALDAGWQFGVDLGARGSCTIGGNVATNAGGNGVLQFGPMREQVLGLEAVLPDGRVLSMLRPMLKDNTGYDLKHWFIGAEGTLGVVTRVLLRLRPRPAARQTALVGLPDADGAVRLLAGLQAAFPGAIAAFELMWRDFLETALAWQGRESPLRPVPPLAALIEVTGHEEAVLREALEARLASAVEDGLVLEAVLAQSQAQARSLWALREATAEFPSRMHPPLNFDISLPLASIGRFVDECRLEFDRCWPGHRSVFFGHVGDGNLHLSTDLATVPAGAGDEIERRVYGRVREQGGSVSAEHGIGLHKKPWLGHTRSPVEVDAMRAIKRALDPLGLMNPGRVFEP